jgi:hypothetical protein
MFLVLPVIFGSLAAYFLTRPVEKPIERGNPGDAYWMLLHRTSNVEYLLYGKPGIEGKSKKIRTFRVKAGVPGKKPTPLPRLAGREYWLITSKLDSHDNTETAPYFLILDIPIISSPPFGPKPYLECGGKQCDWGRPGYFGLHGVNGDESRLSASAEGSSGCVRHNDADITYLFTLLKPEKNPVRYYIVEK